MSDDTYRSDETNDQSTEIIISLGHKLNRFCDKVQESQINYLKSVKLSMNKLVKGVSVG